MTEIPPGFPIKKYPPRYASGLDATYLHSKGKSGAPIPREEKSNDLATLAKAKIAMAMVAIGRGVAQTDKRKNAWSDEAKMAWAWIGSRDFELWCESAGYHPDFVRKKAQYVHENGCTWRMEGGKGKRYEERKKYRAKMKNMASGELPA